MPVLKVKVRRPSADNVASTVKAASAVTRELADICQFPPVRAVATLVLLIFDTVEGVQRNRQACERLAMRAAAVVLEVHEQLRGRWNSAPRSMVKNIQKLESTLWVIHGHMRREAEANWRNRFLRKAEIEAVIADYHVLLDDAVRGFQISSLIDIHHTLRQVAQSQQLSAQPHLQETARYEVIHDPTRDDAPPLYNEKIPPQSVESVPLGKQKGAWEDKLAAELSAFDDQGFPRYQSSRIKPTNRRMFISAGFWMDTIEVEVDGETSLMKRYEGPGATRNWLSDVKALQTVFHPNLPQLIGLSDASAPVPFILLSNTAIRTPEAFVLNVLGNETLAKCVETVLRLYRDVTEAALYTQREMSYSDQDLQNFVEDATYTLNADHAIVVGLPPPKEGNWYRVRNYGLTESLLGIALKMIPHRGHATSLYQEESEEVPLAFQRKFTHLGVFIRALLPSGDSGPSLSPSVEALLDECDDSHSSLTLPHLRRLLPEQTHSWRENQSIGAHRFLVGDLGIVKSDKRFGEGFEKLCNVCEEKLVVFDTIQEAHATRWCWKDMPIRREEMQSFPMGLNVVGWPVPVLPNTQIDCAVDHFERLQPLSQGWKFLLEKGKSLAERFGVKPDELVLVTTAGTSQDFYIKNGFDQFASSPRAGFGAQPFGRPSFSHQPPNRHLNSGVFGSSSLLPKMFYLFTSPSETHESYWATQPTFVPPGGQPPPLGYGEICRIGYKHGYVWYVAGHAEDFV